MELDELDKKILSMLQENGKTGYREIALKLGTNPSTIFNRVRNLEGKGIIKKYSAVLDPEALGFDLTVVIMIRAQGPRIVEIEKQLAAMKQVLTVYDITGDYDVLVAAKFKNRNDLNKFVKQILAMPGVERTTTNLVLSTVKEDLAVPIE